MTTLEKLVQALREAAASGADGDSAARAAIEALRTPGTENVDRIFNAMLDRILREEV